jgi:calcineurin-like phosphoesterase family protein
MDNTWFTSDEHHGHRNALTGWADKVTGLPTQPPRPWSSLEEMTDGLIERHNSVVKRGDKVFHLGTLLAGSLQLVVLHDHSTDT